MGAWEEETNVQERTFFSFFLKMCVKLIGPYGFSPAFSNTVLYCSFGGMGKLRWRTYGWNEWSCLRADF